MQSLLEQNSKDKAAYEQGFSSEYLNYAKNLTVEYKKMKEFDRYTHNNDKVIKHKKKLLGEKAPLE